MLDDFVEDYRHRGKRDRKMPYRVAHLKKFFTDIAVEDITERKIDLYTKQRFKAGITRSTLNRELQVLAQSFKIAKRKKLVRDIPHIPFFPENPARQGFFEKEDFERVLAFLPDHLTDVMRFAYYTGWRIGEILTLEWRDIIEDEIHLRQETVKNDEGRVLLIVGEIAKIMERRHQDRVDTCPYVFHKKGKQIKRYFYAWGKARTQSGLPHKLVHDFRRTAVRNMDEAGVPRQVAKGITGHKTDVMYNRYRIVPTRDIRKAQLLTFAYLEAENRSPAAQHELMDI
jgi:integrase